MALTTPVVLFDLDNTLFDHHNSLKCAIFAVQEKYAGLAGHRPEDLITSYNAALQQAYDKHLSKEITYEEADILKVQLFFTGLSLTKPSLEEVGQFRAIYKTAYRGNRRATPGSIETLTRLRDRGCRLAIVTNGQIDDQAAKAEAIGVKQLVDRIVTSEEVGYSKPDLRIFQFAAQVMHASSRTTYMVGDSIDADVKGAIDAGFNAVLYSPTADGSATHLLFGSRVPVIRHMFQLPKHLGVEVPR